MHFQYNYIKGGITKHNRKLLDLLNQKIKEPFKISDATNILRINKQKSTRLLAYWTSKGWLARVKKGLYITVPLGTTNPAERKEDPWIVASQIFSPCYIGGWSACEHWGLTEQIFNSIVVFSSHKVRKRNNQIQGIQYLVKNIPQKNLFGTSTVWRQQTKIKVSDPSRTLVDILDNPSLGGGMRHITDIVREYFNSEHKNKELLINYIKKIKNKTIYKKLGYIVESLKLDLPDITNICQSNISKGFSIFDPTLSEKGKILRRWNLKINTTIKFESQI